MELKYHSQYAQDTYVYHHFLKLTSDLSRQRVFVDIGAYDGVRLSNTYTLEQVGWTGWCFEPIASKYDLLVKNRPNSKCFNCAIGNQNKIIEFCYIDGEPDMLSGVASYYPVEHSLRINKEAMETNSSVNYIDVEMKRLGSLIAPNTEIDYLSLDTEGGEADILEDILVDFSPYLITVEANYENEAKKILEVSSSKYIFTERLGCDMVLIRK